MTKSTLRVSENLKANILYLFGKSLGITYQSNSIYVIQDMMCMTYAVIYNIDDTNSGNKTLLLEYIKKIYANKQLPHRRFFDLMSGFDDIYDLISKKMIHTTDTALVLPNQKFIKEPNVMLAFYKLGRYYYNRISRPNILDQISFLEFIFDAETENHKLNLVITALKTLSYPILAIEKHAIFLSLIDEDERFENNKSRNWLTKFKYSLTEIHLRTVLNEILPLLTYSEIHTMNQSYVKDQVRDAFFQAGGKNQSVHIANLVMSYYQNEDTVTVELNKFLKTR